MFWKRKRPTTTPVEERPLYECNPAELDLALLHHLQAGLTAKLLRAQREVVARYETVLAQAERDALPEARTRELNERTERLKKLNTVLESELSRFQDGFQPTVLH